MLLLLLPMASEMRERVSHVSADIIQSCDCSSEDADAEVSVAPLHVLEEAGLRVARGTSKRPLVQGHVSTNNSLMEVHYTPRTCDTCTQGTVLISSIASDSVSQKPLIQAVIGADRDCPSLDISPPHLTTPPDQRPTTTSNIPVCNTQNT
jgi:hypothetical protein